MMTALATVVAVEKHELDYQVELSCDQQTSCSGCRSQKSCGTGVVSKVLGNKSLLWSLKTKERMSPGQVVEIGLPEKSLLTSASIVYLVPLFALMLGAFLGQWLVSPLFDGSELPIILISAIFVWGGVYVAKRLSRLIESKTTQQVVLLRKFGDPIS